MNDLTIFTNEQFGDMRSLVKDNRPWFVGKDITEILGYSNSRKALGDHVDEEDKGVTICDTLGGKQNLTIINESGLYSLILASKLPQAKLFKRWVTNEVLPTIRKTGGYIPHSEGESEQEILAKAFLIAQNTIKQKDELLKAKSAELESKNKFINQIAASENSLKVVEVAQIASKNGIKIGQNRLWDKLREWGLIKKNSKYDPKQEYIERGYFEVVEGAKETDKGVFTYKTTRVLGKGQKYIIERLIKESMN